MTIRPRDIPLLKKSSMKKGANYIERRSFPSGQEQYFRMYEGSTLPLHIVFKDPLPQLEVVLYNNLTGVWSDLAFQKINDTEFHLDLVLNTPGRFLFKVKFKFHGSTHWYWDSVPHTLFYVDPIALKNLKIYTLIPTVSGKIKDWMEILHRIKKMHFNAVHLLPITQLDISESPYSAHDLFTIDANYANPDDVRPILDQFHDFVELAKSLEIRLCVDLVMNHIGITSNLLKECPDWITSDEHSPDSFKRAGCWENHTWKMWGDLVLIKYDHPNKHIRYAIWRYMRDYALFWANYAAYTEGLIRFDNLHSMNGAFFQYLVAALNKHYPRLIILAELFSDQHTCERYVVEYGIHLLLATPWVAPYANQTRDFLHFVHKVHKKIRYLIPLNSHDSGPPAQEYGDILATIPRYLLCTLLGTGAFGMTFGVEFGLPHKIDFIKLKPKSELGPQSFGHDFTKEITYIHELVSSYPYLQTGGNIIFVDENHPAVIAAYRFNPDNVKEGLLVVANLDTTGIQEICIPFKKHFPESTEKDITYPLGGPIPLIEKGFLKCRLLPCSYRIIKIN